MIVLCDSREPPDVVELLRTQWPNASLQQLQTGDVNIPLPTGLLVVERKTPGDLLSSIGDGRLFEQADRMVALARWPIVIVHGAWYYNREDYVVVEGRETRWRGKAVRAALRAVQWAGCAVENAGAGKYAYTRAIQEALALASKPEHRHFDRKKTRKPPINFFPDAERERQHIEFIASIPGVGPKRAESLLRWCGEMTADEQGEHVLTLGTPAIALEWASSLPFMPAHTAHPKDWGHITLGNLRAFLGLRTDEYLQVRRMPPNGQGDEPET